jgi:transcriptional regulator with XRE-family HTH domain
MAIGERIRFFRNKKGVTQKYLGQVVGFPERSADVRMAQYETGSRTPKADLTRALAGFFEVSTDALTVPDIDSDIGLMHTLFALEDIRGLTIGEIGGEICLKLDKSKGKTYVDMLEMLSAWAEQAKKLEAGEITKEDYDRWRYNYPKYDTTRKWVKVPSKELSDFLVEAFKDRLGKD